MQWRPLLSVLALTCLHVGPSLAQSDGPDGVTRRDAQSPVTTAPDERTQYPLLLLDSFVGFNLGSIDYSFSSHQLEQGFRVNTVHVPHAGAGIVLFGHHFGHGISAQLGYTRPVEWVKYRGVNGGANSHSVWMTIGSLSLRARRSVTPRLSLYGDAGLAFVSRRGFLFDGVVAVAHERYVAPIFGAGLEYPLNPTWDAVAGLTYVPGRSQLRQPSTAFSAVGLRYNLRPLTAERVAHARQGGYVFPRRLVQATLTTNLLGYGLNNAVSSTVPVFWGGNVQIARGVGVRVQQNVFHTRSRLALDLGVTASVLKTFETGEHLVAVAAYPLIRWTFLRRSAADVFVSYSIAGPSYLSKRAIDRHDNGSRFTFQDILGIGMFVNSRRDVMIGLDIGHYSNGNLFPANPGIKIPATLTVGRSF